MGTCEGWGWDCSCQGPEHAVPSAGLRSSTTAALPRPHPTWAPQLAVLVLSAPTSCPSWVSGPLHLARQWSPSVGNTASPTAGLAPGPRQQGPGVPARGPATPRLSALLHVHPDPLGDTKRVQLVPMGWAPGPSFYAVGAGMCLRVASSVQLVRACLVPSGVYVSEGLAGPWGCLGPCQAGKGRGLRPQALTAHPGPSKGRMQALYGFPAGRGTWLRKPLSPHNGPLGTCEGRGPRLVESVPEPDLCPDPVSDLTLSSAPSHGHPSLLAQPVDTTV